MIGARSPAPPQQLAAVPIRRSVRELSDCTDHDAWSAMLVAGSARKRLAQVPCPRGRGGCRERIWVFCAGAWAPLSTAC